MARKDRIPKILDVARTAGQVEVAAMASELGVSEMTIRRDLEHLEAQGLLRRFHGGATISAQRNYEPPFVERSAYKSKAKERIAELVAASLAPGDTVIIDVGTTALAIAEALRRRSDLTVLTPSLRVATLLGSTANRVVCLGGQVRPGELSLVGDVTQRVLRMFEVDVCVLGVAGLHPEKGLTEYNSDDAAVKRVMIEQSRRVELAIDSSKIGAVAFAVVAPVSVVDTVYTDSIDDSARHALRAAGVEVHAA